MIKYFMDSFDYATEVPVLQINIVYYVIIKSILRIKNGLNINYN